MECIKEHSEDDELAGACTLSSDAELVILFMRYFLNLNGHNTSINDSEIADRVSCKELFFLFLLRSIGGYVLDTNVGPASDGDATLQLPAPGTDFMLPAFNHRSEFKRWLNKREGRIPLECFECWALYSSGENELTRHMVRLFVTYAGYVVSGHNLQKAAVLPDKCEAYLKKEDIARYGQHLLDKGISPNLVRKSMQNARGLPIMLTITAPIRRCHAKHSVFFKPELSAAQFIKIERYLDEGSAAQFVAPELNILKTYYNSHAPALVERGATNAVSGP